MLSVVHRDDPVPRLSRASMMLLATEVRQFAPTAARWQDQDVKDVKQYAANCGRKGQMDDEEVRVSIHNCRNSATLNA